MDKSWWTYDDWSLWSTPSYKNLTLFMHLLPAVSVSHFLLLLLEMIIICTNWFNSAIFLCLSQVRTWISNVIVCGYFYIQWFDARGDCLFLLILIHCLNFLCIRNWRGQHSYHLKLILRFSINYSCDYGENYTHDKKRKWHDLINIVCLFVCWCLTPKWACVSR